MMMQYQMPVKTKVGVASDLHDKLRSTYFSHEW